MNPATDSSSDPEPGPERVNALCDGMVAIALTVLALEIRFPEGPRGPLRTLLGQMLRSVLTFSLSFTVISGFWLAHHRLSRRVRRTSRGYSQTLVVVLWPTVVFLVSTPLALVHATAAMLAWMLAAFAPLARSMAARR